ncbi:hypothetical protein EMIT0196MI5_90158 [Pseudomonas sp. IT-196MI5]
MHRSQMDTSRKNAGKFNFDLQRMTAALEGGTISFPRGQTHEERIEWIREKLREIDTK